ncbi:MAG: MoaD/ThiS family protein [Proteobacteria bacterium]|nr:MoaD/ThiS family protein [Pseudomonadota bacterium]
MIEINFNETLSFGRQHDTPGTTDMHVIVKLFATFRKDRFDVKTFELPDGVTVGEIIDKVNIPVTEVALIFINSRHSSLETKLSEGDTLALFPPIGGG